MSSAQNLFTALRALILQSVDQAIFLPVNIKQGFQPPTTDKFISFVVLSPRKTSVQGYNTYDDDANTKTNILLYNNPVQVDFYSDTEYDANDAARTFHQYLTANGDDYLTTNYNGTSIGEIDEITNQTSFEDKGKYLFRYTIRFELFTHEMLVNAQVFIDDVVATTKLIN